MTDAKADVLEKEISVSSVEDLSRQKTKALVDEIPDPDPGATPEERAALVSCRTQVNICRKLC